jgi:hypothetical protein
LRRNNGALSAVALAGYGHSIPRLKAQHLAGHRMSMQLTSLLAQGTFSVLFFGCLVALWAILRPPMIRDDDERPLPPLLVVRIVLVILYITLYLMLVGTAWMGGKLFTEIAEAVLSQTWYGWVKGYLAQIHTNAAGFAFIVLLAPMSLVPMRELERRFLVWLHRGSHLSGDGRDLALHLAEGPFVPSEEERQRSLAALREMNLLLSDTDTRSIKLVSVEQWRKVNALLHLLQTWNTPSAPLLTKSQTRRLARLDAAHERKTRLALGIVSLLARGGDRSKALSTVSRILDTASHGDPTEASNLEGSLMAVVGAVASMAGGVGPAAAGQGAQGATVTLSSHELEEYLRPINAYFAAEYRLLLEELSALASTALIHAGDAAGDRLEDLKRAGFGGLGLVERMDIPRLFLILFGVTISGFAIFALFRLGQQRSMDPELVRLLQPSQFIGLGVFSLILAVAALIGAYTASNGGLARREPMPWRSYLQAGFVSVLAFFVIWGAQISLYGDTRDKRREALEQYEQRILARTVPSLTEEERAYIAARSVERRMPSLSSGKSRPLLRRAPYALLPFAIVLGMCLLARLPGYSAPGAVSRSRWASKAWERTIDGFAMSTILLLAGVAALLISQALGLRQAPQPGAPAGVGPSSPLFLMIQFAAIGFAVGLLVMRDVRLAAHARLVTGDLPAASTPPGGSVGEATAVAAAATAAAAAAAAAAGSAAAASSG